MAIFHLPEWLGFCFYFLVKCFYVKSVDRNFVSELSSVALEKASKRAKEGPNHRQYPIHFYVGSFHVV